MSISHAIRRIVGWCFLCLLAGAAARAGVLPSYDRYDRWLIACDNTLHCEARGISEGDPSPHLAILREAGPEGALQVIIVTIFRFEPADLRLDGVALRPGDALRIEKHSTLTKAVIDDADAARAFIRQIRNGKFLEFQDRPQRIPLAGLTAALLRMDERQQRVGTSTALIRGGETPAHKVPPAPPVPRIEATAPAPELSPDEEAELLMAVQQHHDNPLGSSCYDAMNKMTSIKAKAWPIDAEHALVAIPCTPTDIWQLMSFFYIVERRTGGRITLFQPEIQFESPLHPIQLTGLYEPDFDPLTGRLYATRKLMSTAVCGYAGQWQWQKGEFVLAHFSYQRDCGGMAPGNWPTIHRSKTVTASPGPKPES